MPEINYAPDPRPQPPTTAQSRNYGTDVYEGKAPAPPANRRKAAVSYTAAGALAVWDVISGTWVTVTSATVVPDPLAVHAASYPGVLSGVDDVALETFDDYAAGAITSFTGGSGWGANGVGNAGCSIVSRTMADGRIHNRLSLAVGSYARAMPWGAFWNRIKIVLMLRINGTATHAADGFWGIASGQTNMVDSATCSNWIGVRVADGTGNATAAAGTKNPTLFNMGGFRCQTKRVNSYTDHGGMSSGHYISGGAGYLSPLIWEISRPVFATDATGVNYSVGETSINATSAEFSRTKEAMFRILTDGPINNSLGNSAEDLTETQQSAVTATPFSFDQSTGVLDTINFYWPQLANPLEIAAFGVRKIF